MRSNALRRLNTDTTTRAEKAMERIEASWVAWDSPVADVTADGWRPVDDLATNPLGHRRGTKKVIQGDRIDEAIPLYRKIIRWLRRQTG